METTALVRSGSRKLRGDHVTGVYSYAARNGAIDTVDAAAAELGIGIREVHDAVDHLVEHRLLRVEDGPPHRFVPVDPEVAAALLVSSMERQIYQRRELIDQVRRRIDVFRQDQVGDHADTATDAVDYVVGEMEVRGFLKVAGDACRDEVLVLQSNRDDIDEFDELAQVYLALLDRGVTVRIISQHRSRVDLATRMRLRRLADAGATVRTVSQVPRDATVFDRSLAVLFGSTGGQPNAARVHDRGVVQFLLDMVDHIWDVGTPVEGGESGYENVADDLQQAIAGLMAKGYTDEVVARKLGMSVRTCRRHIAALLRELDAISRFQAGVQAARRSLVIGV